MNSIVKNDLKKLALADSIDDLRNKTVVVVGANGLIAQYFTKYLMSLNEMQNLNIKVVAMVRNYDKATHIFEDYLDNEQFVLLKQDVCDELKYDGDVDYILHAAGAASPRFIINDPVGIIKANTVGTINVLEFAREKKASRVLFTSTREIYGKTKNDIDLISENEIGGIDTLEPRSCYPESKRISETILEAYYKQYNVPFSIARIAHTYGPTMEINNDGRVMADFISFVVNNQNINLNSDGSAMRSFCYITDAVNGLMKIMLKGKVGEAYNLSNETEPYAVRDVAKMLVELFPEKNLSVTFNTSDGFVNGGYNKIKLIQMNTAKIQELGWMPKVKLLDGMKNTVMYFEEEKEKKLGTK